MQKLSIFLLSSLVSLVVAEFVLRAFTPYPIHGLRANRIEHQALGYVLDPEFPESDASGFRNPDGMGEVDLVTLGDSHTYGFNVGRSDNWPSQLADAAGITVYNHGMGGYGVLQHFWLFSQALDRNPSSIIVGLYLANDLADTCLLADTEFWKIELSRRGLERITCEIKKRREGDAADIPAWRQTALGSAYHDLVGRQISVLRAARRYFWFRDAGRSTPIWKRHLEGHVKTTDRGRTDIAAAYALVLEILDRMAQEASRRGVRFGVLLIPSKESVLFEASDPPIAFEDRVARTVKQEREITRDIERELRARGIRTANAISLMREGAEGPLYPAAPGGHPLRSGYRLYAVAAESLLGADASK